MTDVVQAAVWLFTREGASIRVVRQGGCSVIVNGPRHHRSAHTFDDELTTSSFILGIERGLLAAGWTSQGLETERRLGGDRRQRLRLVPDRRRDSPPGG